MPNQAEPLPQTMTAIRFHEYGDASVLQTETLPLPVAKSGQVLVRVAAASVNPLDWKLREGYMKEMMPLSLPFIPGCDFAGTIVSVQSDAPFAAGDAVFGGLPPPFGGTYAQYVAAAPNALTRKPDNLSFVEAASVPVVAMTAWESLRVADLQAGQSILIQGGAGSVGLFAVQFAKQIGATIYATCSGRDKEFVKSLGADTVIDYKNEKFEEIVKNVNVVLDTVGGETQEKSWQTLKSGGILIAVSQPPDQEKAKTHGVRAEMLMLNPTGDLLAQIGTLLQSGAIKTEVGKTFPLAEAKEAQELSQNGHIRGKIVLTMEA